MGNRYYLTVDCPFCKIRNQDVYFAPTCGLTTHKCEGCNKLIHIGADFVGYKHPQMLDMRNHSSWGKDWEEKIGKSPFQYTGE